MKKKIRDISLATTMIAMLFSIVPVSTPMAHAKSNWGHIAGEVIGGIINRSSHKKIGGENNKKQDGGNVSHDESINQEHLRRNPTHEEKLFLLAVKGNDYETAQSLLDSGIDINIVIPSNYYLGETALGVAMSHNNRDMMQFLLERGANVNGYYSLRGGYVCYIVHAAKKSDVGLIKYLHEWGADLNGIDTSTNGNALNSIIWHAVQYYHSVGYSVGRNDIECVRYLAENGIDLEIKQSAKDNPSVSKRTPFIAAVNNKWYDIAKILADCGADLSAMDDRGRKALDIALESNDMQYYKQIHGIIARGQQPAKHSKQNP